MVQLKKPIEDMQYILVTDVGSTTTKARFFHKTPEGWRFLVAGEAPTTVESPYEDVTLGVRNAVQEITELTGHSILLKEGIQVPYDGSKGVDLYCTTSSAGGGLQMMVTGLVASMTAESANRAALGAGSIVMDVMSVDDGRPIYERIRRIRSIRPDMILLAGGTDGGDRSHVLEFAEIIKSAKPAPRFGQQYQLPIVYAGNKDLRPQIKDLVDGEFALDIVDNIRPVLEIENTEPARRAIHEQFMEHVMSHAPGYTRLMNWTDMDIMPTPAGEGLAMQLLANNLKKNVIGVGLGGATTNIYSIFNDRFVRSVSANLGMSYSITNVMKEAGIKNIMRWLPFEMDDHDLRNRLMNKMIRPTTIPQTLEELVVEHSVAREALRLGLEHHKSIARNLKGVKRDQVDLTWIFKAQEAASYIDMLKIDVVAGTGGLLSHAPNRAQSMLILNDAFQPEGITWFYQDSVFMMPHLGLLSTVHQEAAWEIFNKDCLVRMGTFVKPRGVGNGGSEVMKVQIAMSDGSTMEETIKAGELKLIPLGVGEEVPIKVTPGRGYTFKSSEEESGPDELEGIAMGGEVGLVLDGRGSPIAIPEDPKEKLNTMRRWFKDMNLYTREWN